MRLRGPHLKALTRKSLSRSPDRQPSSGPIDVGPAKAAEFAVSRASLDGEICKGVHRVAERELQERLRLSTIQHVHLMAGDPWGGNRSCRVGLDQPPLDGQFQGLAQDSVVLADGALGETFRPADPVDRLDVNRLNLIEPEMAKVGHEVLPDHNLIATERRGRDVRFGVLGQPPF